MKDLKAKMLIEPKGGNLDLVNLKAYRVYKSKEQMQSTKSPQGFVDCDVDETNNTLAIVK